MLALRLVWPTASNAGLLHVLGADARAAALVIRIRAPRRTLDDALGDAGGWEPLRAHVHVVRGGGVRGAADSGWFSGPAAAAMAAGRGVVRLVESPALRAERAFVLLPPECGPSVYAEVLMVVAEHG